MPSRTDSDEEEVVYLSDEQIEEELHVANIGFSPDGRWLQSTNGKGVTQVWDAESGAHLRRFKDDVQTTVRIWDADKPGELRAVVLDAPAKGVVSPDRESVLSIGKFPPRLLDVRDGHELRRFDQPPNRPHDGALFSPDGTRAIIFEGTHCRVWSTTVNAPPVTLEGHTEGIVTAGFSHDGSRIVTASIDGTARVWDSVTGKELHCVSVPGARNKGCVLTADFFPDGRRLLLAGHFVGSPMIWDTASEAPPHQIDLGLECHYAVFAPGYRAALFDIKIPTKSRVLLDLDSGKQLMVFTSRDCFLPQGDFYPIGGFSPDGSRLAGVEWPSDGIVWNVRSGDVLFTFGAEMDRPAWYARHCKEPDKEQIDLGKTSPDAEESTIVIVPTQGEIEPLDMPYSSLIEHAGFELRAASKVTLLVPADCVLLSCQEDGWSERYLLILFAPGRGEWICVMANSFSTEYDVYNPFQGPFIKDYPCQVTEKVMRYILEDFGVSESDISATDAIKKPPATLRALARRG